MPSLGAVGRLTITSRVAGEEGASIAVAGGRHSDVKPAALSNGTVVELRDMFYATPARLKFLRTDRAEAQAVGDVVKRLAMAEPFITFILRDASNGDKRTTFRADAETGDLFDALHGRLRTVLGRDFADNALPIDAERDGFHLTGYAALPTYSRGAAVAQYLFVNGRPVRDKMLLGHCARPIWMCCRGTVTRWRHLFVDCDPTLVDVNVHPAKSEVRFREPAVVRGLIVSGLRHALAEAGHRASTTVANATLGAMRPELSRAARLSDGPPVILGALHDVPSASTGLFRGSLCADRAQRRSERARSLAAGCRARAGARKLHHRADRSGHCDRRRHAAHERLVYEKLKKQMAENGVAAQALLDPRNRRDDRK